MHEQRTGSPRRTLVVMAAGLGARYGGLKQLERLGPSGETLLDYSVFDAMRAGFNRVVFVIRRDFETAFRSTFGDTIATQVDVRYAFQDEFLPDGLVARSRPWGTGHAILSASNSIEGPFGVVNADDFYGAASFSLLSQALDSAACGSNLIAFRLANTLSEHGPVKRGVCQVDSEGFLIGIEEYENITRSKEGFVSADASTGSHQLTGEDLVSMNMWGFQESFIDAAREVFLEFVQREGQSLTTEFFLPTIVDHLMKSGGIRCRVIETQSKWFGLTYTQDKPGAVRVLHTLHRMGEYPVPLWPGSTPPGRFR